MDYGNISPSPVPHITTLTNHFSIEYLSYERSLAIQISFILLLLPFLVLAIYFSSKNKAEEKVKKKEIPKEQESDQVIESVIQSKKAYNPTKQDEEKQNFEKLKLYGRRFNYGIIFFVFHVISANNLDSDLISLATFYTGLIFYVIFNTFRQKKHVFLLGLFMIPVIISSLSFFLGDYELGTHI